MAAPKLDVGRRMGGAAATDKDAGGINIPIYSDAKFSLANNVYSFDGAS